MSAAELATEVLADKPYFDATGGGVTLSGGEPLVQAGGLVPFLERCGEAGIDRAIETCGDVSTAAFDRVIPVTDRFLFDIKAGTDEVHEELTGRPLRRIIENARRLLSQKCPVTFRRPVVPGSNDSDEDTDAVVELLEDLGAPREITLLRYHRSGEDKNERLGKPRRELGITPERARESLCRVASQFELYGFEVTLEGEAQRTDTSRAESAFSERVWRLRTAVQEERPKVCAERALLWTSYFRNGLGNGGRPLVVQQAEALRHVLRNKVAQIYPDELLVGCFSSKRVGGSVLPELHGVTMMEDLLRFDRRELNPLGIERADKLALLTKVIPYWSTRFLALKAFSVPRALTFAAEQLRLEKYVINEAGGISHFVPDYERLLTQGTDGIAREARERGLATKDNEKKAFYEAVSIACSGLEELAAGFARAARSELLSESDAQRRQDLERIAEVCQRVPRHPARTLHEAFQSLLFAQIALNLESLDNSVSPGRLDQLLHPYFESDLEAGRADERTARELVGCFTVKMSEIVPIFSERLTRIHGGMFNGQVVTVGGVNRNGEDAVNQLTWAFIDAMEELKMRQPNYHTRIHAKSPKAYLDRISAMLRDGPGSPSLMNDDVVVPMLEARGMELGDARDYSPVGCVEPVACGATFGSTDAALVNIALCLEWALGAKSGGASTPSAEGCATMDAVLYLLEEQMEHLLSEVMEDLQAIERANACFHPTPLTSALLQGCLESGVDSTAGGARYNSSGLQPVGLVDVGDSLAAIDDVVFRRRLCRMADLISALRRDFVGAEPLLGNLLRAPKYGNDDERADCYVRRVARMWAEALGRRKNTRGGKYFAGLFSVTSHQPFGEATGALPSGRRSGRPLANGLSPTNGLDRLGPTASLSSAAAIEQERWGRNGINLNLKLDATTLDGRQGVDAVSGLIRGYFSQGGMQVQMNVLDPRVLIEARDDPSAHPWLLVRVSGYSAYFSDLSPAMKQEIIERSLGQG